jgi:O-antigen/teichoic acid export membrane protein
MQDVSGSTRSALRRWPPISPDALLHRLHVMLGRRPFLKNVSIMLTGSAAGQTVSIALSPILTRLYTPEQFGILSVYSALLTILVVVASLRYELALPLAASDEDAINLVAICGCVLILTTAVIAVAAFVFPEETLEAIWPTPINSWRVAGYRGLLVLGFLCLGGYFIALYLATRQNAYRTIARTRLYQGIVGPLTQIGLGAAGAGAPGLLIGSILGQSTGTLSLFYRVLHPRRELLRTISLRRMAALARRYCRFPLIASWSALLDVAGGNQLLYLIVSTEYSARIAGFIFLAERIVARPLSLVGTSILQVFVGEAGKTVAADPDLLRRRFYQVVSRQFLLAAMWVGFANLAAVFLFARVFGTNWGDAVIYLQAMSVCYLAQAVVLPVIHTLQLLERQAMAAAWQTGRLLLIVSAFGLCIHYDVEAPKAILLYSGAQGGSCFVLLGLMARAIRQLNPRSHDA